VNRGVNYECVSHIRVFQASSGKAFALKVSENSDHISMIIGGNRAEIPNGNLPNTCLEQTAWQHHNCGHSQRIRDCFVITYNGK
jgi:hypothetical protein